MLKTLPDTPERAQQELTLQIALGAPLMATKGFAAPEVESVYTRARELCQQVGETPQLFPVLWGCGCFISCGGSYQTAARAGRAAPQLGSERARPCSSLEAHLALGDTLFCLGEFASARAHLEQGIALYDPQQHHSLPFSMGRTLGVLPLLCGLDPVVLGYPDQALKRSQEALTLAQELSHPLA